MTRELHLPILAILLLFTMVPGCTIAFDDQAVQNQQVPAGYGSIQASSDPWGALVYLDGMYKGKSPVFINNISEGEHKIIFSMDGYSDYSTTITVTKDKTSTIDKTLVKPKPSIKVSVDSIKSGFSTPNRYWEVSGTVINDGEGTASDVIIKLEMNPEESKYSKFTEQKPIGYLNPGESRAFYIKVNVESGTDYSGKLSYTYKDEDDKSHSGTVANI